MNKETYEALKRIMSNRYGKKSLQYKSDVKQVEDWIDEVAKHYEEEEGCICPFCKKIIKSGGNICPCEVENTGMDDFHKR